MKIAVTAGVAMAALAGGMVHPPTALPATSNTRYAAPAGTGLECSHADPCAIETAINNAPNGATILLAPGSYGSRAAPLGTALDDGGRSLDIRGTGSRNPVIFSSADSSALITSGPFTSVSRLDIRAVGEGTALDQEAGTASRISAWSAEPGTNTCVISVALINSICRATGNGMSAIIAATYGRNATVTLIGVDAMQSGPTGLGVDAASGNGTLDLHIVNSVASGRDCGVRGATTDGGKTTVTMTHTVYNSICSDEGVPEIDADKSSIKGSASFRDAAAGDFRERASSVTVNAGISQSSQGSQDLAGASRTVGRSIDIGAYEFLQKAKVGKPSVSHRSHHGLRVHVAVNPEGLPARARLLATHAGVTRKSGWVSVGAGRKASRRSLTIGSLTRHRTYVLDVLVENAAGSRRSPSVSAKTT